MEKMNMGNDFRASSVFLTLPVGKGKFLYCGINYTEKRKKKNEKRKKGVCL